MKSIKDLAILKPFHYYVKGKKIINDPVYIEGRKKDIEELNKKDSRTDIINFLLAKLKRETTYLEIGVRDPSLNFAHIKATVKYSVDPGVEFKKNPVDFKLTSDEFFEKLSKNEILSAELKFDAIFIDGLHLAEQVDRDISNALNFIKEDGFVVLHDCNPPTEWHARTEYYFMHTPAHTNWNGSSWKAFLKRRCDASLHSCCIDSDWGVGILSKNQNIGQALNKTIEFYEFKDLNDNRQDYLNLMQFDDFKTMMNS